MIRLSSNSLRPLANCERQYFYSYIEPIKKAHEWSWPLEFGHAAHEVLSVYDRVRLEEKRGIEEAVLESVKKAADLSMDWPAWRETTTYNSWNLARIPVWYADQFGSDDSLEFPVNWPGGSWIEREWEYEYLGVILNGRIDKFASVFGENYIVDRKSTTYPIDGDFIKKFSPDIQFSLYLWAGRKLWPELNLKGILCEGIQLLVNSVEFERFIICRSQDELDEFEDFLIRKIEDRKRLEGQTERLWIKNEGACFNCFARKICSSSLSERKRLITLGD